MYFTEPGLSMWQQKNLPEGFHLVTDGVLQIGDIRWNYLQHEWNLSDPTTSPKHDIIIGDSIKSFKGVCRKGF